MQYISRFVVLTLSWLAFYACNSDSDTISPDSNSAWDIPSSEVVSGGVGRDGIPSVDNPQFLPASQITYMQEEDLIVGFLSDGEIKGYTHPVLDWHEIVNDRVGDTPIAITYCPLTGSAIGWDRRVDGQETTFGVSGLLYNTNLIPYDRLTETNWSQMGLRAVNGALRGRNANLHQVVEMPWSTWKAMYPEAEVLTTATGFTRNYGSYPYRRGNGQDYREDDFLLFSVDPFDERLPVKERVLGVTVEGSARAYRFSSFDGGGIKLKEDELQGHDIVIVGSKALNFLAAYERRPKEDDSLLTFTPVQEALPVVMEDDEGNHWDVFGRAVSGPRQGQRLKQLPSYIAYWMAWAAFNPETDIYDF